MVRLLPALNARAQTHLVANMLGLVGSLLRRRPIAAEDLLAHLAHYLYAQMGQRRPLVPLAEEVQAALSYLGIERARLGSRLRVDVACDDAALCALVPALVLQPLVENAVRHGVARKPGGGCVRVRARISGGRLLLVVSDDGQGLSRERSRHRRDGWGLSGVRLRLAALWGTHARLRVLSCPGSGTIAAITVPVPAVSEGEVERPVT
jgi:LytS/YehU family sensor histidine kinase